MGVVVFEGNLKAMFKEDVVEPVLVKEQGIKAAFEAASMILRIDDVIAASKVKSSESTGKKSSGTGGEESESSTSSSEF